MNYPDLIKEAFWITLRNRHLWFFGFFAGAGTNFSFSSGGSGDFDGEDGRQASTGAALAVQQTALDNLGLIVALVVLGLLIFLVFVIVSLISQGPSPRASPR